MDPVILIKFGHLELTYLLIIFISKIFIVMNIVFV